MNTMKSLLVIILLLFLFPVGIVVMWFVAPWSKSLKWVITLLIPGLLIVLLILFLFASLAGVKNDQHTQNFSKPATQTNSYTDSVYPIAFNYPSNWMAVNGHAGNGMGIKGQEILNSIVVSDAPLPITYNDKSPSCELEIDVFNNPAMLTLEQWNGKNVDALGTPKDDNEKAAANILRNVTHTQVNGIPAIANFANNEFFLTFRNKVYRLDHSKNGSECKSGYDTVLNSLKFTQ